MKNSRCESFIAPSPRVRVFLIQIPIVGTSPLRLCGTNRGGAKRGHTGHGNVWEGPNECILTACCSGCDLHRIISTGWHWAEVLGKASCHEVYHVVFVSQYFKFDVVTPTPFFKDWTTELPCCWRRLISFNQFTTSNAVRNAKHWRLKSFNATFVLVRFFPLSISRLLISKKLAPGCSVSMG